MAESRPRQDWRSLVEVQDPLELSAPAECSSIGSWARESLTEPYSSEGFQFRDLRSLTSENWNGFTVGVQGTADEVFPPGVPEPTSLVLPGTGLIGLIWRRRQSKQ
ncbi:MAG TPA: PEP-CTERM sorting domain-containing protein [Terriglobia bacterium]|nr:PEP-CTERM sorting domain-containing protein [Terriglobia bacterium]